MIPNIRFYSLKSNFVLLMHIIIRGLLSLILLHYILFLVTNLNNDMDFGPFTYETYIYLLLIKYIKILFIHLKKFKIYKIYRP